jgi:hypothetical protein
MKPIKLPMILQPFYCDDLVRLGKDNDGGYLVNRQDVEKTTKLVSLGIGGDCSFEEDFIKLNDCPCVACDASAQELAFFTDRHQLIKHNVGKEVFLNDLIGPDDWSVFLKCDVDGDEYGLLNEIIKNSRKLSGLVIEFHNISRYDNFNLLTSFMSRLDQKLVHTHINNYFYYKVGDTDFMADVIELSFTSSPNISLQSELSLPHRMDMPNNSADTEFRICF